MRSAPKYILIAVMAFTSALLSSAMPPEQATAIRVRIMDSRTHRPLKRRKVQIIFSGMDGRRYLNTLVMIGHSGPDGVVVFEVKRPMPPRMEIVDLAGYPCSRPEDFVTREILENGVVAHWPRSGIPKADEWCTPGPQAAQPQQKPEEVVFFVHPLNWWQNFWYTLLK